MNANENPWVGLLSYQDPYKSKGKEYVFCGRDSAVSSIFSMVDNSILVTIYGKTGIGKTSVLNAGVCPLLRSQGYLPILVRLGTDNFSKNIISRIEEEVVSEGGRIETLFPELKTINDQSVDYLWRYLCTTSFISKEGDPLFPVVILDQLEEIFVVSTEKSTLLLKQLYALIDDNREIPEEEGYSSVTNYRFVISIREDDLFYLEDAIDANYLFGMKQNRYRLAPLKESEAKEIIALGKKYIEVNEFEEISNKLIKHAKDENGQISTNVLSLICSQVFLLSENIITLDILNSVAQNPLESFYDDCLKHISVNTKVFIENNLVENYRRRFVKKEVFENENIIPVADRKTLTEGQYRIVQDVTAGNIKCVELIHDSIARTIFTHKISEQKKVESLVKKRRNRSLLAVGLIFFIIGVFGVFFAMIKTEKYNREKGLGVQQKISINFIEDNNELLINDFWRATISVIGINDSSTFTILNEKINDQYKDSTIYFVTDTAKSIRLLLTFDKAGVFSNIDTIFTIGQLTDQPNIKIPIRKVMPNYIEYSSQVVSDISGVEIGLSNAIVVIRNIVQRTTDNGFFKLDLLDSLTNTDVMYIVKDGFEIIEQNNVVLDKALPNKFVMIVDSDFFSSSNYLGFDSVCRNIDKLLNEKVNWRYGYGKYKQGGYRVRYSDGKTDNIIILAQRNGTELKGVYWYAEEYKKFSAISKPHYAYHLFEGSIEKEGIAEGESANFEITGWDIFNNKQSIRGMITWPGVFSGEIISFSDKRVIGKF